MNKRDVTLVVIGIAALGAAGFAVSASGRFTPVPEFESEAQFLGMGVKAGLATGDGTVLDVRPEVHFWAPESNPRDAGHPGAVIKTRHRYPVLPGGNISTVIHGGWSAMANSPRADADWFLCPPAAEGIDG